MKSTTPPAAQVAQSEREQFEAWYTPKYGKPARLGDSDQYHMGSAQGAWQAWQARAALARPVAQSEPILSDEQIEELWTDTLCVRPLPQPAYVAFARAIERAALASRAPASGAEQAVPDAIEARTERIRLSTANQDSKGKIQLKHEVECLLAHIAVMRGAANPSAILALLAQLESATVLSVPEPDGWQIIPKKMTYKMKRAAGAFQGCAPWVLYEAMLEVAPTYQEGGKP